MSDEELIKTLRAAQVALWALVAWDEFKGSVSHVYPCLSLEYSNGTPPHDDARCDCGLRRLSLTMETLRGLA